MCHMSLLWSLGIMCAWFYTHAALTALSNVAFASGILLVCRAFAGN
jgi:hypothetical protein